MNMGVLCVAIALVLTAVVCTVSGLAWLGSLLR